MDRLMTRSRIFPAIWVDTTLYCDDNDDDYNYDDVDDAVNICCLTVASAQYVDTFCTAY